MDLNVRIKRGKSEKIAIMLCRGSDLPFRERKNVPGVWISEKRYSKSEP